MSSGAVLDFPRDAFVVVAGVPGAGKTTLLRRLDLGGADRLDSDDVRDGLGWCLPGRGEAWRLLRPLVHPLHHLRLHRRLRRPGPVVVHAGTRRWIRGLLVASARMSGHEPHLVVLEVDGPTAREGQRRRGRRGSERSLSRHLRRAAELPDAARAGGFASVTVLTRAEADRVAALRFVTAPAGRAGRAAPRARRAATATG